MRILGPLLVVAALALPARADDLALDYSDLWWNPAHAGWGLSLERQSDVMFATLFVYGADGTATWLVASDVRAVSEAQTSWSGKLYRGTGPAFSAVWNAPAALTEVGTLRVDFAGATTGTLTYTVDGATVVEPLQRITLRPVSFAGAYNGGLTVVVSSCNDDNFDGPLDLSGPLTVTDAGTRTTIAFSSAFLAGMNSTCSFTGESTRAGRMGAVQGTWRCTIFTGSDDRGEVPRSVARLGNFTLDRIMTTSNGFAGHLVATDQDCRLEGRIGGVKLP
jgi:hypothetical protein